MMQITKQATSAMLNFPEFLTKFHEAGEAELKLAFPQLQDDLKAYDADDILASAAALQLIPANAHCNVRLHTLADMAVFLPHSQGAPQMSTNRLRAILSEPPLGDGLIPRLEDPFEGVFTDTFGFFGGECLAIPAVMDDDCYALGHLCRAIFLHREPFPDETYANSCRRLIRGALAISTEMCRRAGLGRNTMAPEFTRRVLLPQSQAFRQLKEAVTFSSHELQQLLEPLGCDLASINPLLMGRQAFDLAAYRPTCGPLLRSPFVQSPDGIIVGGPGMILSALREHLVSSAVSRGINGSLARRFHASVHNEVCASLRQWGPSLLSSEVVDLPLPPYASETVWALDTDKVMHVIFLTDPLDRYDTERQFILTASDTIAQRLDIVAKHLCSGCDCPNEVFALVLAQAHSGMRGFQFNIERDNAESHLLLAAPSLQRIIDAEPDDPPVLWKYAAARAAKLKQAPLSYANELDAFAFYRRQRHSFYQDDVPKDGALSLAPGFLNEVVHESARTYDRHAAPSFNRNCTIPVILIHGSRDIPIYTPDPPHPTRAALLVEGCGRPIWVIASDDSNSGMQLMRLHFCDLIGYWIWQMTPLLAKHLATVPSAVAAVVVCVVLEPSDSWLGKEAFEASQIQPGEFIEVAPDSPRAMVHVRIRASALALLRGPTNHGELSIVGRIVQGILDVAGVESSAGVAARAIAQHAAEGAKKKMVALPSAPELDDSDLPRFRHVQEADEARLLDAMGLHLAAALSLREGEIPAARRTAVMREGVAYLYTRLKKLVASLRSEKLLEFLVSQHESLMCRHAHRRTDTAPRIACFGQGCIDDVRREMREEATANVALRFLIEFVVAQPPKGLRPISISAYDELLAICNLIIQYGTESDLIHLELADIPLSMLPSGRLGANREQFQPAKEAYFKALSGTQIAASTEEFLQLWDRPPKNVQSAEATQLERAAVAEFGWSISDLTAVMAECIDTPARTPIVMSQEGLYSRVSSALGWPRDKVQAIVTAMALAPRLDFLAPPSPAKRRDVEPWNFNRAMSYLRRPFLLRGGDILYGYRHLIAAHDYLIDLCGTGRLCAQSKEMKDYIARRQNARGRQFEARVANGIAELPELVVRRAVDLVRTRDGNRLRSPGDIDVLAADRKRRVLWLVECKDLATSRTPSEFANEMKALVRDSGSHRSAVTRHAARLEWTKRNLSSVLSWLEVSDSRRWRICPAIVIDTALMTPFLVNPPIPIMTLDMLLKTIANGS